MKTTESQRRSVLTRYPNSEAAKLLRITRERCRQLRQELRVPVTSKEARWQSRLRQGERDYLICSTVIKRNRPKDVCLRRARRYAEAFGLPFEPYVDIEQYQNVKIYRFASWNSHWTWEMVGKRFGVVNACSQAAYAAQQYGLPWPLRMRCESDT